MALTGSTRLNYDGYRARLERDGSEVRLCSKSGLDWTWRFPWIIESSRKNWKTQFITDGEIVLGIDGISDFKALHSGKYNGEAQLYARAKSRQCRLGKSEGLNFL
jgi:ATP-dependent DNA ligase